MGNVAFTLWVKYSEHRKMRKEIELENADDDDYVWRKNTALLCKTTIRKKLHVYRKKNCAHNT